MLAREPFFASSRVSIPDTRVTTSMTHSTSSNDSLTRPFRGDHDNDDTTTTAVLRSPETKNAAAHLATLPFYVYALIYLPYGPALAPQNSFLLHSNLVENEMYPYALGFNSLPFYCSSMRRGNLVPTIAIAPTSHRPDDTD